MGTVATSHGKASGLALAIAALLLAGCASTRQTVDHEILLQPGTAQYRMDELEVFVMPMELDAPMPAFPAAVTARELAPVTACAEIWLSETGDVTHVAAVRELPGCGGGDADPAPFEASVLDALAHWSFTPPMVCRFREDQRAQREAGDCRGDVEVRRVPVRLAYAFHFERHAGRASVGSRRIPE